MFTEVALQQMSKKLQQLCIILQEASEILCAEYEQYIRGGIFSIDHKCDQSPVTQADLKANAFISHELEKLSPMLPILSEEGQHEGREDWQQFWMLDPLDGTKEFINQTGEFTINLSLIDGADSVVSAIAVPLKKVIYISEPDQKPYRYQWIDDEIKLFQFSSERVKPSEKLRIAMSRRPERNSRYVDFKKFLDDSYIKYEIVSAGSAYKFCMMLEGDIDIYPRFYPTSEWDTAAGQGLLQSIGGEIFTLTKQPFKYNQRGTLLNSQFIGLRDQAYWQVIQDFLYANQSHLE